MPKNVFEFAEGRKIELMNEIQREIKNLYKLAEKDISYDWLNTDSSKNVSSELRDKYLYDLLIQLKGSEKDISKLIGQKTLGDMNEISEKVINDNSKWLESVGLVIEGAYSYVPEDIVEMLVSGKLYKGDWTYSKAIWQNSEKISKDLNYIVAKGIAEQKPTYDIAKDLEKYVDPSAAKPWNWSKVYPGTNKVIDYNAQRLARTLINHSYQESLVRVTKNNPFVEAYKWLSSNSDRTCPLCIERSTVDKFGLGPGVFPKDQLPMDHPNGLCTWRIVQIKSDQEIANDLANWAKGNGDPALNDKITAFIKDAYGKDFNAIEKAIIGGKATNSLVSKEGSLQDKLGSSGAKRFNNWYKKMDSEQKALAKQLKEESGLNWQDWYKKNIYNSNKKTSQDAISNILQDAALKENAIKNSSIPEIDKWIDIIKSQTEENMLSWEDSMMENLSSGLKESIRTYTGGSYKKINGYLRLQTTLAEKEAISISEISIENVNKTKEIINGLKDIKTTKDLVLRRGTNIGDLAGFMPGDFQENFDKLYDKSADELNDMFEGSVGKYAGFTSTSSLWGRGFSGEVEMVFYAPKGVSAQSIMRLSQFGTDEGETLLNAGTNVLIRKIEECTSRHKSAKIRVFAEILK